MPSYRILVVTNLWPAADDPGYGSFVQAQMESLWPLGVDFDVLFINGRKSVWNYVRGVREMRSRLRASRYDLIHAHFGLSGLVARCQFGVPIVVSFMGDDVLGRPRRDGSITLVGRLFQLSSFILARAVSGVIVKSRQMKAKLRLDSAHIIPNGVDLSVFRPIDPVEARHRLGLDPGKKWVLFPYDPAEQRKRYDLIEAAVAIARASVPELDVLRVRRVPRDCMPVYMNAADVFVLASVLEGSPNAVKEAMAVNLPIVAVDVGDVRELIELVEGCYVVRRDARSIAEKIVEVCRRGARTRGRDRVARLSSANVAKQIVAVYDSVLGRASTRGG